MNDSPSTSQSDEVGRCPEVEAFYDEVTHTVSYLVHDPESMQAAIIDPVLDYSPHNGRVSADSADRILACAEERGLELKWLLETHAHADHLSASYYLRERTGAPIVIGRHIDKVQQKFAALFDAEDVHPDGSAFDRLVEEGETLPLGKLDIAALHTPGHTPACVTYVIGDAAFIGDTLFMPDYGTARADFPGGDAATLYRSIRKLFSLPPETRLFTGHDYQPDGHREPAWQSSVAEQKESNIHVGGHVGEKSFVEMREARDQTLDAPKLILPSLQVNIRAGAMPPASGDGKIFLKIPVNAI